VMSAGSCILAALSWALLRLKIFQQPALLRVEHRVPDRQPHRVWTSRMQGGFQANPLAVLAEDAVRNTKDAWYAVVHGDTPKNADGYPTDAITRMETEIRSVPAIVPGIRSNSGRT
jgi:hypothetical protein